MKPVIDAVPSRRNSFKTLLPLALLFLFLQGVLPLRAQDDNPEPPPLPPLINMLNFWQFDDTNLLGSYRVFPPKIATNLYLVPSWESNAVEISSSGAMLQYNVVETNGSKNVTCQKCSIYMWLLANWSSGTNSGPGTYSRLWEIGSYTTNATLGWLSLFFDPTGTNLFFSGQTNGASATYLTAPVSITSNEWIFIALTWSPSNSTLFTNGVISATGSGAAYFPGPDERAATGLSFGSDSTGQNIINGQLEWCRTYDGPVEASWVAAYFNLVLERYGDGGGIGLGPNGPNTPDSGGLGDYTNGLALIPSFANGTNFHLDLGQPPAIRYDLISTTNLSLPLDWSWVKEVPTNSIAVLVTNASDNERYYELAKLIDLDALQPSYYVGPNALPGADGSLDLPFPSLAVALAGATNHSVIVVLPGTYAGSTNRNLSFGTNEFVLMSQRGADSVLLDCGGEKGFIFNQTNQLYDSIVVGMTISNAGSSAVSCSGLSGPSFVNCFFSGNSNTLGGALVCTNGKPTLVNCRFLGNSAANCGGAIWAGGSNGAVRISHCSFSDNPRPTGGGTICLTNGSTLLIKNSIVWSSVSDAEILSNGAGGIKASYCDVRGGFTGIGNINSDPLFETNGTLRLTVSSPCIDQGTTNTLPGFRLITKLDMDGEARLDHGGFANTFSTVDIGADEYVYRLQFPLVQGTNWILGADGLYNAQSNLFSEVGEASGVAYLGTNTSGPLIAVIDDEARTNFHIYQLNADASAITASYSVLTLNSNFPAGLDQEIHDMEGINFDSANSALYLITSQTKRNRYRDVDTTPPISEPLVDPPSSDYDHRRAMLAKITLDGTKTNATAFAFFQSESNGVPTAVGYDATNGLIAFIRRSLTNNSALLDLTNGTRVMIACNNVNKFGTPTNGIAYSTNAFLPYSTGGPTTTAGVVLVYFDPGSNSSTFTHSGLTSNSTYFYKIWSIDSQTNYYAGPTVGVTNNGLPRILINEFYASGTSDTLDPDWIELYNPAFVPVSLGGLEITDSGWDSLNFYPFPTNQTVAARGFAKFLANNISNGVSLPFSLKAGGEHIIVRKIAGTVSVDDYNYGSGQNVNVTEGRVWDAGPRGFIRTNENCTGARFITNSAYSPTTLGQGNAPSSNHTNRYKHFTVTADVKGTSNYLAWQDIGLQPAVWRCSPKQHDFHSINIEDVAFRSTNEMVFGLRAPLSVRTNGNAYYFVVTNLGAFLPGGGWAGGQLNGIQGPFQMDLGGLGFRSIKWCGNGLTNGTGPISRYLVLAGSANGGPLQREDSNQKFSLYSWTGNTNSAPQKLIDNLKGYATRPEGVDLIQVNGEWRVIFVEDRFQGLGYATRNALHWPLSILGPVN